MKLIGINGFKRSGKGTVFEGVRAFAVPAGRYAADKGYADKLKQYAALSLGYTGTPDELYNIGDSLKLDGVTIAIEIQADDGSGVMEVDQISGRQYLQNIGNEARELFGEWFWVDQVTPFGPESLARVWRSSDSAYGRLPDYACVTDLRYENEATRVRTIGGVVIEVTRPGIESDGHASEQPLPRDLVDFTVVNDGSIKDLQEKVWNVMNVLEGTKRGDAFNL